MTVSVRSATAADAPLVAGLASEFAAYLRALGDPDPGQVTEAQYQADGFGPRPAFAGLIGELDADAVGYLLYCHAYDLDRGGRVVQVVDLFVRDAARGRGVGRALMQAVARICRDAGGRQLCWSVYPPNERGRRFYEGLGAEYVRDLQFMYWKLPAS